MNRTIKFRGKRLDNGEWVYGYYAAVAGTHKIVSYKLDSPSGATYYEVAPETVGQFTGLLDRNGKEVYEGDLLKEDEITWEIFWCDDVAAFMVEQYNPESDAPKMFLLSDVAKDSEVIGNIYDNPELMKQ